jgi:DNA topoisomerase-2
MAKALRENDIQTLSEIEHCLLRPGVWIGSTKEELQNVYVYNGGGRLKKMDVWTIPGLLKIFDEVISNSVDESIRTNFKFGNQIKIWFKDGEIRVKDNGRGLPIEKDSEGVWTPETIVTQLRAGSNFDDETKGEVVGMNGVGVSLSNIYSNKFRVYTANGANIYNQKFENHLSKRGRPTIKKSKDNFTEITFTPNYDFFSASERTMEHFELLIEKRIRDLAFCYPEIRFTFNNRRVTGDRLKPFLKNIHDIFESSETKKARIGVFYSDTEFQQTSFVNGAETKRGGSHIDYVMWRIVDHVRAFLKKKHKIEVKPIDIKSKVFLLFSMRMQGPEFDNQTKERLITPEADFKPMVNEVLTDKFLNSITRNPEIIDPIVEAYKLKMQVKENLELKRKQKNTRRKKIAKLIDATAKDRLKCTLFIVEGDSAGATFLSVRNEFSGALKLKGKVPNVHDMKPLDVAKNEEYENIMVSMGLEIGVKAEMRNLNFGRVSFLTDADVDGNHISGLLLNFFYKFWPELFDMGIVTKVMPPLYIAKKKKGKTYRFYSFTEWDAWKEKNDVGQFEVAYFKGLGGLDEQEYEKMINEPNVHVFEKDGESKGTLKIAFGNDSSLRKEWMSA